MAAGSGHRRHRLIWQRWSGGGGYCGVGALPDGDGAAEDGGGFGVDGAQQKVGSAVTTEVVAAAALGVASTSDSIGSRRRRQPRAAPGWWRSEHLRKALGEE